MFKMTEEHNITGSIADRQRRTSTWEFLPNLGINPRNVYKFNESVVKDRHLFKSKGHLVKKKVPTTGQTEMQVALPVLNQVHLSLDIENGCDTDDGASDNVSVSTTQNYSPRHSARFNEPLNAYVSARKKTHGFPVPAYMEAFPRSLPSVDQTTMARKLATKRRFELQRNYHMNYNRYELLPLLRFSDAKSPTLPKACSSPTQPQFRLSRQRNKSSSKPQTEKSLRVWDPTVMDTLMKTGKVLVPKQ